MMKYLGLELYKLKRRKVFLTFALILGVELLFVFMSADRRLAIFLTDELAKTGGDEVRMTHDQMAKYMGSAREVVSRMLKYFAQEGWVRLYRGGVQVLDKPKLQQLARGE